MCIDSGSVMYQHPLSQVETLPQKPENNQNTSTKKISSDLKQ